MKGTVLFITGIDTNIGKTFATGMIACAVSYTHLTLPTNSLV